MRRSCTERQAPGGAAPRSWGGVGGHKALSEAARTLRDTGRRDSEMAHSRVCYASRCVAGCFVLVNVGCVRTKRGSPAAGAGALEGIHAGGRWGPMARRSAAAGADFPFFFFCAIFLLVFMGIRRACGHAITPCDSLSALLTVP